MNVIEIAKECGLLDAKLGSWDYANRLQLFAMAVCIAQMKTYPTLGQLFAEYQLSREPK